MRCCDISFAGDLLPHLTEGVAAGLRKMARICRPGGRLAVFHPIGRVALAARHGGVSSDDDVIAPNLLTVTGCASCTLLLRRRAIWRSVLRKGHGFVIV